MCTKFRKVELLARMFSIHLWIFDVETLIGQFVKLIKIDPNDVTENCVPTSFLQGDFGVVAKQTVFSLK